MTRCVPLLFLFGILGCESLPDKEELKDIGDVELSENCKFDASKKEVICECQILVGTMWCRLL